MTSHRCKMRNNERFTNGSRKKSVEAAMQEKKTTEFKDTTAVRANTLRTDCNENVRT